MPIDLTDHLERFMTRVNKTDGCWEWKGRCKNGYPTFYAAGIQFYADVFIYRVTHNTEIGKQRLVRTCKNPRCVKPEHLELRNDRNRVYEPWERLLHHLEFNMYLKRLGGVIGEN